MTRSRQGSPRSSNWARRTTSRSKRPRTPAQFTDANLARFKAVIWLSTTADVLDATQQAAFERYIRAGGGYVGVHAASDTEYDWPWYGNLVGAYFSSHPAIQPVTVRIEDTAHPSNAGIPANWNRTDECTTTAPTRARTVHVLANLDEATYTGGTMNGDHPISWCRHTTAAAPGTPASATPRRATPRPNFRTHLLGGIKYAAQNLGNCSVQSTRRHVQPGEPGQGRGGDR